VKEEESGKEMGKMRTNLYTPFYDKNKMGTNPVELLWQK